MADLSRLPKVDVLAGAPELASFPIETRREAARSAISKLRASMLDGAMEDPEDAVRFAFEEAVRMSHSSLKRVINASGVILHTGLGRARLAPEAARAIAQAAENHSAVEIDLETGERGDRQTHICELLIDLTGAADAFVVNNCAAAVFLTLSALCDGRGVLLSRSQMIEIGGQFRMPDIVRRSGCSLVEVGCTNKTHVTDYAAVDGGEIAAILRCHPSNFRMIGFVEEPSSVDLATVAKQNGWLLIDDIGSGSLVDVSKFGLEKEPTIQDSLKAGADVVLSSGDKMLGGPQVGLILGSKEAISTIRAHPLARAVRIDKLTLAGLEATLRLYKLGRTDEIPTIAYLSRDLGEIKRMAQRLSKAYIGESFVELGHSEVGGGSIPGQGLPTWRVGLRSKSANELAKVLRTSDPAILGRIENGLVWLDPRTMDLKEVGEAVQMLRRIQA